MTTSGTQSWQFARTTVWARSISRTSFPSGRPSSGKRCVGLQSRCGVSPVEAEAPFAPITCPLAPFRISEQGSHQA